MAETTKNVKLKDPKTGVVLVPYTGITVPTKTSDLTNDSGFLTTHQTIKQDGVTGATSNRYAICTTSGSTAAKEVNITAGTYNLETGSRLIVKFTNKNTADNPTLKVGSTAAKNIYHNGLQITTGENKGLLNGAVEFVYDGTQYDLVGNYINTEVADTRNTAGATDTSSKIYLVGATEQSANPQTYTQDTAFVDASGQLNSANPAAGTSSTVVATTKWVSDKGYLTPSDVTSTYSGTGTDPVNGTAVKSAIDAALTSAYKPSGSIAYAALPTLSASVMGNVYNITDSFTIDNRFVEYDSGVTKTFPAGSEVGVVNTGTAGSPTYKFSVMSGFIDLSGYQQKNTAVTHTASTKVGGTNKPVYIASTGAATACTYELNKSVPSDAVFTDTTYNVFTGADGTSAGTSGLVKAPAATDNGKFLRGDGTWATTPDSDTKNTAGATDSSAKLFLVGATSQGANPQTFSQDTAFVDTDGRLNSAAPASNANDTTVATTAWVAGKGYLTSVPDLASSKITLMTGYSKASSASAIATTDTLNTAIGKIEKALDGKQATISNLSTIESGAAAGATALQPNDDVSNLNNDAGYLTTVDWTDIQNTPSTYAPSAHNQASNTINLMTGYSKASSASAIATTDTLNQAIGKLEKALDGKQASGNYVTTARTINNKALSADITLTAADVGALADSTLIPTVVDTYSSTGTDAISGKGVAAALATISDNDTKNTAGGDDTSSKIFLVGMTAQTTSNGTARTYTQDTAFVDANGRLNSAAPATNANDTTVATTAWVAGKGYLTVHQTVKQDGITGATVNRFGTCSTGASTAAKTVSITSGTFSLETGASVRVKFSNANTADTPTLNVNSKGAKNIFHKGSQITTGGNKALLAGVCDFVYDGTQWHLVGNYIDNDTTSIAWNNVTGKPSTFTPATHSHVGTEVTLTGYSKASSASAVAATDTVNAAIGKLEKAIDGKQASGSYVTTSRTVNSKALSSDITLAGGDIAITSYSKPSSTSALAATDTVNAALGKLEKALDGKQASGTYVTKVNNNSPDANGNVSITIPDALPSQTGNSGKFLTTNGSTASWATVTMPTVDQTYNASSTNAQSGVAVASAVAAKTLVTIREWS